MWIFEITNCFTEVLQLSSILFDSYRVANNKVQILSNDQQSQDIRKNYYAVAWHLRENLLSLSTGNLMACCNIQTMHNKIRHFIHSNLLSLSLSLNSRNLITCYALQAMHNRIRHFIHSCKVQVLLFFGVTKPNANTQGILRILEAFINAGIIFRKLYGPKQKNSCVHINAAEWFPSNSQNGKIQNLIVGICTHFSKFIFAVRTS